MPTDCRSSLKAHTSVQTTGLVIDPLIYQINVLDFHYMEANGKQIKESKDSDNYYQNLRHFYILKN